MSPGQPTSGRPGLFATRDRFGDPKGKARHDEEGATWLGIRPGPAQARTRNPARAGFPLRSAVLSARLPMGRHIIQQTPIIRPVPAIGGIAHRPRPGVLFAHVILPRRRDPLRDQTTIDLGHVGRHAAGPLPSGTGGRGSGSAPPGPGGAAFDGTGSPALVTFNARTSHFASPCAADVRRTT